MGGRWNSSVCMPQLTALEGREGQHVMAALLDLHRLQELTGTGLALVELAQDTPLDLLPILLCQSSRTPLHVWSTVMVRGHSSP